MMVVTFIIKSSKEEGGAGEVPSFSTAELPVQVTKAEEESIVARGEHNIMSEGSVSSLTNFPKKREASQTLL